MYYSFKYYRITDRGFSSYIDSKLRFYSIFAGYLNCGYSISADEEKIRISPQTVVIARLEDSLCGIINFNSFCISVYIYK